jgi:hypothetical protein
LLIGARTHRELLPSGTQALLPEAADMLVRMGVDLPSVRAVLEAGWSQIAGSGDQTPEVSLLKLMRSLISSTGRVASFAGQIPADERDE